ncbi:hypothetical protein DM860_013167 [Cuscuta australis]|uniref:Uncharacterized protein n=1 Tax=Cuscuta australis TaxID=267555 RepID=A0A328DNF4_9ASTE|nr:hypothetical protein DM860_013167 [Cuscuta australis]
MITTSIVYILYVLKKNLIFTRVLTLIEHMEHVKLFL